MKTFKAGFGKILRNIQVEARESVPYKKIHKLRVRSMEVMDPSNIKMCSYKAWSPLQLLASYC